MNPLMWPRFDPLGFSINIMNSNTKTNIASLSSKNVIQFKFWRLHKCPKKLQRLRQFFCKHSDIRPLSSCLEFSWFFLYHRAESVVDFVMSYCRLSPGSRIGEYVWQYWFHLPLISSQEMRVCWAPSILHSYHLKEFTRFPHPLIFDLEDVNAFESW